MSECLDEMRIMIMKGESEEERVIDSPCCFVVHQLDIEHLSQRFYSLEDPSE